MMLTENMENVEFGGDETAPIVDRLTKIASNAQGAFFPFIHGHFAASIVAVLPRLVHLPCRRR